MENFKKQQDKHIGPLSKRTRSVIWAMMFIIFMIIAPVILAYSVGYRFNDFEEKFSWIKTGGVYIHSSISNADIYIDGEYIKSGGVLVRNSFVQNLKADTTHVVEVRKSGYHGWIKKLPVMESMVTEGRVLMVPIEIEERDILPFIDLTGTATSTQVDDYIINSEYLEMEIQFGLASSTEEDTLTGILSEQIENIKNQDLFEDGPDNELLESLAILDIPEYFIDLGIQNPDELDGLITLNDEIAWLESGNIIMHWIGKKGEEPFYYCNSEECKSSFVLDWDEEIIKFNFLPGRNDSWIVMNSLGLWAVEVDDRSARNIQPIYQGENLDFNINKSNNVVVLNDGIFYELDF